MLNPDLFLAFLLITVVLIITPGPVVTLVIATGATEGARAALVTVLGTTIRQRSSGGLHRLRLVGC